MRKVGTKRVASLKPRGKSVSEGEGGGGPVMSCAAAAGNKVGRRSVCWIGNGVHLGNESPAEWGGQQPAGVG